MAEASFAAGTEELIGFGSFVIAGPIVVAILIWELWSGEWTERPSDDPRLTKVLMWITIVPVAMGVYWITQYFEGGYRDSLGCGILSSLFAPVWLWAASVRRRG